MTFGPNERDYEEVVDTGRYGVESVTDSTLSDDDSSSRGGTSAVYIHVQGEYGLEARYWFDESESGDNYMFCQEVLLPNTDVNQDRYVVSEEHMYLPEMVARALHDEHGCSHIIDMDRNVLFAPSDLSEARSQGDM